MAEPTGVLGFIKVAYSDNTSPPTWTEVQGVYEGTPWQFQAADVSTTTYASALATGFGRNIPGLGSITDARFRFLLGNDTGQPEQAALFALAQAKTEKLWRVEILAEPQSSDLWWSYETLGRVGDYLPAGPLGDKGSVEFSVKATGSSITQGVPAASEI